MGRKNLVIVSLWLFCLSSGCAWLAEKKYPPVLSVAPPFVQKSQTTVPKGECTLHIKNLSDKTKTVCANNVKLGEVEANSEKIFFNCLDCRGGELTIMDSQMILAIKKLTIANSRLYWSERPQKGNTWLILICPNLMVEAQPEGKCQ